MRRSQLSRSARKGGRAGWELKGAPPAFPWVVSGVRFKSSGVAEQTDANGPANANNRANKRYRTNTYTKIQGSCDCKGLRCVGGFADATELRVHAKRG